MATVEDEVAQIGLGPWAQGKTSFRALMIVNERAGSVRAGAGEKLQALLGELGGEVIAAVSSVADLEEGAARGADLVVVLGGDGTARAAAQLFSEGPPLVLLPGGTLNVLPSALYGERDWPDALSAAIRHGRVSRLVAGSVNGKSFFVAAVFGAPTLLARVREAVRARRLRAAWRRLRYAFRRLLARKLAVRTAGGAAARAEAVGVLCPAYRGDVEGHSLEWVTLNPARVGEIFRLGLRAAIGDWRDDPAVELSHDTHGEVRSLGIIPAMLDGEPTTFVSRVTVTMHKQGPQVLSLD